MSSSIRVMKTGELPNARTVARPSSEELKCEIMGDFCIDSRRLIDRAPPR